MVDALDLGGIGGDFTADFGGGADLPGLGADVGAAVDAVGDGQLAAQAQLTAGNAFAGADPFAVGDGFDGVAPVGDATGIAQPAVAQDLTTPQDVAAPQDVQLAQAADPPPAEAGLERVPPAIKDGDWLHDPRQLTPDQAQELQRMLDSGTLHPISERAIREFLQDYRNGTDRLFPEAPNPLPRPYPWADPNPNIG